MNYDSREMSSLVYHNLSESRKQASSPSDQKEQKSQAVELYSYVSTWGLLRLKAEEFALSASQKNKRDIVQCFFKTLSELIQDPDFLVGKLGLQRLSDRQNLSASEYLGLTGVALQLAHEFAFWAEAIYPKEKK